MVKSKLIALSTVAGLAPLAVAQLAGWEPGEVNTTLCTWSNLRAAVIRDTLYMDGGQINWRPGMASGEYGSVIQDDNTNGIVYTLSFSKPFNTSQNISALFDQQSKGSTASHYYDGAMLANNDDYFLFGGLLIDTDSTVNTDDDDKGLAWQQYAYGVDQTAFSPKFKTYQLPDGMTRYISYGGQANAPSENLAFYFSGLRGPTWGEIDYGISGKLANETSSTLITLDMAEQGEETWTNVTLPEDIPGRASPELVWVPVGKQGILVALGGVVYPEFATGYAMSENETASENQSPGFMTDINIYDIANKKWYTQTTSNGPGALAQGCAVMQPAQDYSSFNIYWYGGFDGLNASDSSYWNDAVWILSLPSFTWKQASTNRTGYARAGHKCVMPYPDQMMVIGGAPAQPGTQPTCVPESSFIQIFNVSSAEWLDSYNPTVWSNYTVPSVIHEAIGGDGSGGATSTAPESWDTSALGDVFSVSYATSKISTYYPYPLATATTTVLPTVTSNSNGGSGVPKFLAPLLGVLLGLIFVTSLAVGIIVWRRRKLIKKNGGVIQAPEKEESRIMSWINGQQRGAGAVAKSDTVTTSEELAQPGSPTPDGFNQGAQYPFMQQYREQQQPTPGTSHASPHEMSGDGLLVELPADSRAAELSDTGMTPSAIVEQRFSSARPSPGGRSFAYGSSIQNTDQGSLVSSTSYPLGTNSPPAPPSSASHATSSAARGARPAPPPQQTQANSTSPAAAQQPESAVPPRSAASGTNKNLPELPPSSEDVGGGGGSAAAAAPAARNSAGISVFSERERTHLRNSSDPATVSTMDATITGVPAAASQTVGGRIQSPPILEEGAVAAANATAAGDGEESARVVSPPTGSTIQAGEDYLTVSPVAARGEAPGPENERRSAFRESQEDLGEDS